MLLVSLFIYHEISYISIPVPNFKGIVAGVVGKIHVFEFWRDIFGYLNAFSFKK